MRRAPRLALIAIAVAIACAPIREPQSDAPVNVCSLHPCINYAPGAPMADTDAGIAGVDAGGEGGPMCVNNVCLAGEPLASPQHLILMVALPFDSPLAPPGTTPGATYALPFTNLDPPLAFVPLNPPLAAAPPGSQSVVQLLPQDAVIGIYWVDPSTAYNPKLPFGQLNFWVNDMFNTAIPTHVVYRPLWPPPDSNIGSDGGPGATLREASGLGLPLEPLQAGHSEQLSYPLAGGGGVVGPAGGPVLVFSASLQPGIVYERTATPDPPFDVAFPPDVRRDPYVSHSPQEQPVTLDKTTKLDPTGTPSLPLFYVSSAQGVEGWSAYLRDATTKRLLSPVRTLHDSTADAGVLLPTSHQQDGGDALTNAELVIVPQVDSGLATYVPIPAGLAPQVNYPLVPEPVTVTGQIGWSDGHAAAADVTFEATGIYAAEQSLEPQDAGLPDATTGASSDAGPAYFLRNNQNFEYVTTTTAQPDAAVSTYSIPIPRGSYRVSVRPHEASQNAGGPDASAVGPDGSAKGKHAVTVVGYDTNSAGDADSPLLTVSSTASIRGTATVVDGRPLSTATVEAIPAHCPLIADAGIPPNDSPACMPRYGSTVTDGAGSFALDLDPGDYLLRVEPFNGTRLPWVVHPLRVGSSTEPLHVTIPAPVYRGLDIRDNLNQPVANAIVRIFSLQGRGPAIEVGRAITDENGRFDMYLDPAVQ